MTVVHSRSATGGQAVLRPANDERDAADERRRSGPDEYDPTSLDAFYGLLKNERRRRVVRYLDEESPATTLSDLAEHIAAIENDKPERALNAQERKRVYIQLYQYHLPAMDEVGVIAFDGDRGTVERTPKADHLSELLDAGGASPSTGRRSTPADRRSSDGGEQPSGDARQASGGDGGPPGGGRQPSRFPVDLDTLAIYYLGLGLVGAGLFGLHLVRPDPAVVGGAVAGVVLMAAVSCLLVRATGPRQSPIGQRPSRSGATDVGPDSPAAPAVDAGTDRTGPGGDTRSPRWTAAGIRQLRLRRPVIEPPSSNGTSGGSAD